MGWMVNDTPRPLYPQERPGTRCMGGWVGPKLWAGRMWKISPPLGFDPRTAQSVASRYTYWAIPAYHPHVSGNKKDKVENIQRMCVWMCVCLCVCVCVFVCVFVCVCMCVCVCCLFVCVWCVCFVFVCVTVSVCVSIASSLWRAGFGLNGKLNLTFN